MTISALSMVDLVPMGAKIDDIIRLTGVVIEITLDEKNRRDFQAGLKKIEAGIEDLRRLPGTAYAVGALSRELEAARQIRDAGEGAEAVKALLGKLKEAHRIAEAARLEAQRQAKAKALARRKAMTDEIAYQSAREEVQAQFTILDNEPLVRMIEDLGARTDRARLARDAADKQLALGQTAEALVAIRLVLQETRAITLAWNQKVGKMKDRHAKLIKKASGYHRLYNTSPVLSADEAHGYITSLGALLTPLIEGKVDKKQTNLIAADIETLHQDALRVIEQLKVAQEETRKEMAPQLQKTRDLLVIALGREIAEELGLAREAETFLAQRKYDEVRARVKTLKDGHPALETRLTAAYGDWTRGQAARSELVTAISGQQEKEEGFSFRHPPGALMATCTGLEDGLMTTRSYAEANQHQRDLAAMVAQNAKMLRDWGGIAEHRDQEQSWVDDARETTEKAIAALGAEMVKAMEGREGAPQDWKPHDVGGLSARLDACIASWDALCRTATSAEELSGDATIRTLNQIADDAREARLTEGGPGRMVDVDLRNAALARFEAVRGEVSEKLPGWEIFPVPKVEQLRQALEKSQQDIATGTNASAKDIDAITLGLRQKLNEAKGNAALIAGLLDMARGSLDERVKEARKAVAAAEAAAKKGSILTNSEVRKLRERCLLEAQRLGEQVDAVAGRHDSDVLDVFHEGTKILASIEVRCRTLVQMCDSGEETALVLPETFARLVKACQIRLDDKDLKKYRPSEHFLLKKKLEGIEERLGAQEHTTRIDASLQEWDQAYADAMALVQRDIREKATFEELYRVVSEMLKAKKSLFGAEYKDFYEALKGKVKGARQQAEAEDGIRPAEVALRAAKVDIERVIMAGTKEGRDRGQDIGQELRRGQAEALAGQERQKDQMAAWKKRVEVFEARWLPRLPSGEKDVGRLLDIAKKSAGQEPPDYDAANRYLQMAADRAQLAIQFPEGPVSLSISRLPGEAQKWSTAVSQFQTSLDPLDQHFQTLEDPARRALRQGVAELRRQFDPNAFAPIVQRICAKGADADARASAREAGLALVRQYRDVMVRDARFRLLQKHPFTQAGAWKGHLLLQRPLIELERLLLMAVPAT